MNLSFRDHFMLRAFNKMDCRLGVAIGEAGSILRDTLHASRDTKKSSPFVESIRQIELFLQNKPNFKNGEMNITSVMTNRYENNRAFGNGKNKANTKPIQSQSNPIAKTAKWNLSYCHTKEYKQITINNTNKNKPKTKPIAKMDLECKIGHYEKIFTK